MQAIKWPLSLAFQEYTHETPKRVRIEERSTVTVIISCRLDVTGGEGTGRGRVLARPAELSRLTGALVRGRPVVVGRGTGGHQVQAPVGGVATDRARGQQCGGLSELTLAVGGLEVNQRPQDAAVAHRTHATRDALRAGELPAAHATRDGGGFGVNDSGGLAALCHGSSMHR